MGSSVNSRGLLWAWVGAPHSYPPTHLGLAATEDGGSRMSRQDEVSGHCLGPRLTSPRFSPSSCVQEHQRQALATHGCACGGGSWEPPVPGWWGSEQDPGHWPDQAAFIVLRKHAFRSQKCVAETFFSVLFLPKRRNLRSYCFLTRAFGSKRDLRHHSGGVCWPAPCFPASLCRGHARPLGLKPQPAPAICFFFLPDS